ncbi:MAG: hypothetical protein ACLFNR_02385 [Candidatus Paceibacterota bacterium]
MKTSKTENFLRNKPPVIAQYIIYCGALIVLFVGTMMLLSIDEMMEGWYQQGSWDDNNLSQDLE